MWRPEETRDRDTSREHDRLFRELMRECRDNPPGARLSARLRHHLERLEPSERRALVSRTMEGCAPLLVAARRGHAEAVEYLVHVCCADLEQRGAFLAEEGRAPHSVTPVWAAAVAGHADALRALLDAGADPDAPSDTGSTPARSACFMTHLECVRLLAERGADLARPNHHGSTCLINAVQSPRLCRYLLERGVAVDAADAQGKTALHYAVQEHRADTVRVLLAAGADPRRESRQGDDALRTAAARGAAAELALLAGAPGVAWERARLADAHELLGATQLDELSDVGAALASWRRATALRHPPGAPYVEKRPVRAPAAALGAAREWRAPGELAALAGDVDALRTQALLVALRVLGPHHKDTLFRLMYRGAAYADSMQYERAVRLWVWALELRVARDTLVAGEAAQVVAALARLVAEMGAAGAGAALDVLAALAPALGPARALLAPRPRCRHQAAALDAALRCALHLLAAALPAPRDRVLAAACAVVASGARTSTGATVLHLAAGELPALRSTYFTSAPAAPAFPRLEIVQLLLEAGAPVEAVDGGGSTALHVAARAPLPGLAEALVAAGAHLDRPDGRGGPAPARRLAAWRGNTVCAARHVSLACRAAVALLATARAPPPHTLPATLAAFLDLHRVPPRDPDYY